MSISWLRAFHKPVSVHFVLIFYRTNSFSELETLILYLKFLLVTWVLHFQMNAALDYRYLIRWMNDSFKIFNYKTSIGNKVLQKKTFKSYHRKQMTRVECDGTILCFVTDRVFKSHSWFFFTSTFFSINTFLASIYLQ